MDYPHRGVLLREAVPSVHRGEAAYPRGDGSLVVLPPADLVTDVVGGSRVPQSLAPFESAEAELEVFEGSKTSPLICPPEFSSTEKSAEAELEVFEGSKTSPLILPPGIFEHGKVASKSGKITGGTCTLIPRRGFWSPHLDP
jgi:hypothetical protein